MPAFLHIQANGEDMPGTSLVQDLAGVDLTGHTQIVSFYHDLTVGREANSGLASGKVQVAPFTIVKNVDQISPIILDAVTKNKIINAQLRFFDLGPDGAARESYQITLLEGRIIGLRSEVQYGSSGDPGMPLERISILPNRFRHESMLTSAQAEYDWRSTV